MRTSLLDVINKLAKLPCQINEIIIKVWYRRFMQDSSDKLRVLLGHLHHMSLQGHAGHPDTGMPQGHQPEEQHETSSTPLSVPETVNFSMHWRYSESDHQYTTNAGFEDIISEANEVFKKCHTEADMFKKIHYGNHTDRAYLAFYKVPQYGICIGRLPDGSPCCAAIIRIVDGKCLSKDGSSKDITVAELSSVSASPQRHGYGTQLMNYMTQELQGKVDTIELKVDTSHGLAYIWKPLHDFYKKSGFKLQHHCKCDACRLVPQEDRGHLQMIKKYDNELKGSVVLYTDVAYEIIGGTAYERGGGWRACDTYSRDTI